MLETKKNANSFKILKKKKLVTKKEKDKSKNYFNYKIYQLNI